MNIKELEGLTILEVTGLEDQSELVIIKAQKNERSKIRTFRMLHHQDCCECVNIADIDGGAEDLIGGQVLKAYESSNDATAGVSESGTWTFYTIQTNKGCVWIRWLGESNGYYSESVDFEEVL